MRTKKEIEKELKRWNEKGDMAMTNEILSQCVYTVRVLEWVLSSDKKKARNADPRTQK